MRHRLITKSNYYKWGNATVISHKYGQISLVKELCRITLQVSPAQVLNFRVIELILENFQFSCINKTTIHHNPQVCSALKIWKYRKKVRSPKSKKKKENNPKPYTSDHYFRYFSVRLVFGQAMQRESKQKYLMFRWAVFKVLSLWFSLCKLSCVTGVCDTSLIQQGQAPSSDSLYSTEGFTRAGREIFSRETFELASVRLLQLSNNNTDFWKPGWGWALQKHSLALLLSLALNHHITVWSFSLTFCPQLFTVSYKEHGWVE